MYFFFFSFHILKKKKSIWYWCKPASSFPAEICVSNKIYQLFWYFTGISWQYYLKKQWDTGEGWGISGSNTLKRKFLRLLNQDWKCSVSEPISTPEFKLINCKMNILPRVKTFAFLVNCRINTHGCIF